MPKACTTGKRHKWTFVKNTTKGSMGSNFASFSTKGLYKCACGEHKYGEAKEGCDNPLNDLVAKLAGK